MRKILLLFFLIYSTSLLPAQVISLGRKINWQKDNSASGPLNINFDNVFYSNPDTLFPYYGELIKLPLIARKYSISLTDTSYRQLLPDEIRDSKALSYLTSEPVVISKTSTINKQPFASISFIPLRKNPETGQIEKLISFKIKVRFSAKQELKSAKTTVYKNNSVLANGDWFKVKITKSGIYKITYAELTEMGITDPGNVRIYGNGGRMLPLMNNIPRPDDLIENPVMFVNGNDGKFNEGDYILFYAEGPLVWDYSPASGTFHHTLNGYSESSFYFLTSSLGKGKTIQKKTVSTHKTSYITSSFDALQYIEQKKYNLLRSGSLWFTEAFSPSSSTSYSFEFKNLIAEGPVTISALIAARSKMPSSFSFFANNKNIGTPPLSSVDVLSTTGDYASTGTFKENFNSASDNINIRVQFNNSSDGTAEGWLGYIDIAVRRKLIPEGNQMAFRDSRGVGTDNVTQFEISGTKPSALVWNITNPTSPEEMVVNKSGSSLNFKDDSDTLQEYIIFTPDANDLFRVDYKSEGTGKIPNQNLHNAGPHTMYIVTHPLFLDYAKQLAAIHAEQSGLSVLVATTDQIYNEFSSGKRDVAAIRDFIRMCYNKATNDSDRPRYLLLFGDGSYDNLHNDPNNPNFIPTYESKNSIRQNASFVTDDFFGLLDENEGEASGLTDLGIGRFPVKTEAEASAVINKIRNYLKPESLGDWKNNICFIADDQNNNLHMTQADLLAGYVKTHYPDYNIKKIYLDAYPQVSNAAGQFYPEVNKAINQRMKQGALIMNYTGHGNENYLAHEQIIQRSDIMSWDNINKLPVFVTATCEFSRFDDVEISNGYSDKTSAGEMVLLNPKGGAIALFTTTRLVYSSPNFQLNIEFYKYVFNKDKNGDRFRLGDIIKNSKNTADNSTNKRNFTLLGDPALELSYPTNQVHTETINGKDFTKNADTLRALSKVSLTGYVSDSQGNKINDFNGKVYATIFDKPMITHNLQNDADSGPFSFEVQNNTIYKGQATVKNGEFSLDFIVPKDINYSTGFGKISYYADNGTIDAHGSDTLTIGGLSNQVVPDNDGPVIKLYMNDTTFSDGGITSPDPILFARISDLHGINTSNSGIGHDLTAILDGGEEKYILNDYYTADLNSYNAGSVVFPLSDLSPGRHTILLKVWDVYNNSSEVQLSFVVVDNGGIVLSNLYNYPNPFSTDTYFRFDHNLPDTPFSVELSIYTLSGQLVKVIKKDEYSTGFSINPIHWNREGNDGHRLGHGIYIYRVLIRTKDGRIAQKTAKLLVVN